ncbi:class I SAM-dependent methyltransferase [Desulfosediminicola flagellatus]|uniref:class I SAM-dependent methyltransferase n=1 Tax=Desulfosediminicola flagellatus TaxID=2569541 RepID=UPI0010AC1DAC|nr:class I SAM-dependent methyltransferase [Desulfosediminicola flagellatus]
MINDKGHLTVEKIVNFANLESQAVLEIGCGDGRITQGLIGKSESLIAIDPNPNAIATAKKRIPNADFRIGSGETLEFNDASFDMVLFTLSLHHQQCDMALGEAARVLKDSGKILVIEPAVDSEISIICNVFHDETPVLENAIKAIDASIFKIACTEVFYTEWEFVDNQELYNWLFEFYQTPYDNVKLGKVNALLGLSKGSRPLNLKDKLVITKLTKL